MALPPAYEAEMVRFLRFLGHELGDPPSVDNVTVEELLQINPRDVCRYFNMKAFGVEEPAADDTPTHARSNTLKACIQVHAASKRAIRCDQTRRQSHALNRSE